MSNCSLAEPPLCVLPAANRVLSTHSLPLPPPSDYNDESESEDDSESDYEALTAGDRATVLTGKHNKPRTERGEAR